MKKTFKIAALSLLMAAAVVSCKKKATEPVSVETPVEVVEPTPVEPIQVETVSAVSPEVVQKVNDALKDFPNVKAEVVNDELTITGKVTPDQARKIKMSIDALKVGKVNYNYTN
ncbi:transporter [Flavobacterium azooxidireducens]|uniref:Transporter n=1 Tax=Flavobacterium azooxidireducens TaxID=1871076 RepID=A0ABY4KJS4_9FLAO|nr:transporter [Flavobacterium azooxidireducens]UPQ80008.1 transporter [Flavobacterium azooxidireducens]